MKKAYGIEGDRRNTISSVLACRLPLTAVHFEVVLVVFQREVHFFRCRHLVINSCY